MQALGRLDGGLLVEVEEPGLDREVALVDPVALELGLDQVAELVHADLVDEHLDAGAGTVLAQPVGAVEDPEHGLGDLQVVAVVGLDEVVEGRGDARHDRGAAADADLEPADHLAVDLTDPREEGAVVDARDGAVVVGGRERRLELARHQLADVVADEVADVGADVGRRVEELALADAGPRVARDVAHGVAAALAGGQAHRADLADQLGHLGQRHVVDLDVLARGDVRLVQRRVLLGDVAEHVHLLRRDTAEGKLDADHLHGDLRGLALAVDTLLEAEADEVGLLDLAREEVGGLVVEVVELALDDRDDVTRDVLVDLGVVDRARSALGLGLRSGRFHRLLSSSQVAGSQNKLANHLGLSGNWLDIP